MSGSELAAVLGEHRSNGWSCSCGYFRRDMEPRTAMDAHLAVHLGTLLAKAWEEGRCAAARGQKNNPYIDNPSKDGED